MDEQINWRVPMVNGITGEEILVVVSVTGHPDPIAALAAVNLAAEQMSKAAEEMREAAQAVANGANLVDVLRATGMPEDMIAELKAEYEQQFGERLGDSVADALNLEDRHDMATGDEAEQWLKELTGF